MELIDIYYRMESGGEILHGFYAVYSDGGTEFLTESGNDIEGVPKGGWSFTREPLEHNFPTGAQIAQGARQGVAGG